MHWIFTITYNFNPSITKQVLIPCVFRLKSIIFKTMFSNNTSALQMLMAGFLALRHQELHQYLFMVPVGHFKNPYELLILHDDVIKWKHFPALLALCAGNSLVTSQFPAQRRGALMFSLICALNKQFSKQSWGCWFEKPLCSLWCHCNEELLNFHLWTKSTSFIVWIRYFVWNFKGKVRLEIPLKTSCPYFERYDFYTTLTF